MGGQIITRCNAKRVNLFTGSRQICAFRSFWSLVSRDADILLNMNQLNLLRYRGNVSPEIEYL